MIIHGEGVLNNLINKLPFEAHIPGYRYCGPGTKLKKRLARGDTPVNPLDAACQEHDISYSKNPDNIELRNTVDRVLADKAWQKVLSKDSSLGEKAAAYAVTNIMKTKSKLGMGISFNKVVKAASISKLKNKKASAVIKAALKKARASVKTAGGKSKVKIPRVLSLPKKRMGGFLVPLFAGLSATGALVGGAAGVAKAVNDYHSAKKQLDESQRHNKTMEAIALGKGLYLKHYNSGYGLYLKQTGSGLKKKKCLKKRKRKNLKKQKSGLGLKHKN